MFSEKQDSIARSVAVNNACLIVSNMKDLDIETAKKNIRELANYIYGLLVNKKQ
jgi:hypothetical protein